MAYFLLKFLNAPRVNITDIQSGQRHTCVLDDHGVSCWGDPEGGNHQPPEGFLDTPTEIFLSYWFSCALDSGELKCWDSWESFNILQGDPESEAPLVDASNVTEFALGAEHYCAIENSEVICWGYNEDRQTDVPEGIVNPVEISADGSHSCAIDDNGVICWGRNNKGQLDVPEGLVNPRGLTSRGSHTCVMDDNGMHCWGNSEDGQSDVPEWLWLDPNDEPLGLPVGMPP